MLNWMIKLTSGQSGHRDWRIEGNRRGLRSSLRRKWSKGVICSNRFKKLEHFANETNFQNSLAFLNRFHKIWFFIKVVLCARGESDGIKLVEELNAKGMF